VQTPDYHFMVYDTIIVYEHRTETAYIITVPLNNESNEKHEKRAQQISDELDATMTNEKLETFPVHFKHTLHKSNFIHQVEQAKAYIHRGEATQIVLSQQMTAEVTGDPFCFYRHLRNQYSAPSMF